MGLDLDHEFSPNNEGTKSEIKLCNLQSAPGRLPPAQTAFDAPRLNIRVIYFFRVAQFKYSAQEYGSANLFCLLGKSPQNGTERVCVTSAKTFFLPLKIGQK